jgi:hypothetical protein
MRENIWEWIQFGAECFRDGLEVGDGIFGFSELLLAILIGYRLVRRKIRNDC